MVAFDLSNEGCYPSAGSGHGDVASFVVVLAGVTGKMGPQSPMGRPAFALIGAAGYVAPRHMRAVKDVGGDIVAALDPSNSVGIINSYFPDAQFFTEFERFDRHIDKIRRKGAGVDYVSICSPNYLHDAHIRFALRSHADAICEKPLVLNPWNLDGLKEIEEETGRRVNTILQLRLHPVIQASAAGSCVRGQQRRL